MKEQAEEVKMEQLAHSRAATAYRSDSRLEAYSFSLDKDQSTTSTRSIRTAKTRNMEKLFEVIMNE